MTEKALKLVKILTSLSYPEVFLMFFFAVKPARRFNCGTQCPLYVISEIIYGLVKRIYYGKWNNFLWSLLLFHLLKRFCSAKATWMALHIWVSPLTLNFLHFFDVLLLPSLQRLAFNPRYTSSFLFAPSWSSFSWQRCPVLTKQAPNEAKPPFSHGHVHAQAFLMHAHAHTLTRRFSGFSIVLFRALVALWCNICSLSVRV